MADVAQGSDHEEGRFSDTVARRCIILRDYQYPIPVKVAVIKNIAMEFSSKVHLILYKCVYLDLSLLPSTVEEMKSSAWANLRDLLLGFKCDLDLSSIRDDWISSAMKSSKGHKVCNAFFDLG